MSQRIRIKLQSYDHNLVDKSAEKIVKTVRSTGAVITGPIPLPTHKRIFTVLKSPHVNKKAREQFQLCTHKRLLDIYTSSSRTVDALSKLDLPSGVDVEIKAWWGLGGSCECRAPQFFFIHLLIDCRWHDKMERWNLIFYLSKESWNINKPFEVCLLSVLPTLAIRRQRKRSTANWDWSGA